MFIFSSFIYGWLLGYCIVRKIASSRTEISDNPRKPLKFINILIEYLILSFSGIGEVV